MNWPELNVVSFHVGRERVSPRMYLWCKVQGAEYMDSVVETIGLPHCLTGSLFQFHF